MEKGFLDRMEDNAAVRTWFEITQRGKCDSLADGYVSELWDLTHVSVTQNNLQGLKEIWDQWNNEALGHLDEAVTDLFYWLDKRVTPVPTILAETFRSLNACQRAGEEEDIEWRAPWLLPDEFLYRCEDFDWVPLLRIWGAVGYAPLLVLRQYRSRQFVPATQGLAECEFSYRGDGYKKKFMRWPVHRIRLAE
ncbi:hypothetical protein Gogos_021246 [Gossypium gossypioides]|uniref:Uncharacterized protein n=1 Tax=Gossypium gossypioides TaxID=34282 RepID=A0A7J9D6P8_GOSGO|nr:hypothetical protein [Gossypium gossypioides]